MGEAKAKKVSGYRAAQHAPLMVRFYENKANAIFQTRDGAIYETDSKGTITKATKQRAAELLAARKGA